MFFTLSKNCTSERIILEMFLVERLYGTVSRRGNREPSSMVSRKTGRPWNSEPKLPGSVASSFKADYFYRPSAIDTFI